MSLSTDLSTPSWHLTGASWARTEVGAARLSAGGSSTSPESSNESRTKPVATLAASIEAATPGGGKPSSTCSK
eukprot:3284033-Pyramimonas_sp.AAC.1